MSRGTPDDGILASVAEDLTWRGEPLHCCDVCGALVPATRLTIHANTHISPAADIVAWLDSLDTAELEQALSNAPLSVGPVEAVLGVLRQKAAAG